MLFLEVVRALRCEVGACDDDWALAASVEGETRREPAVATSAVLARRNRVLRP